MSDPRSEDDWGRPPAPEAGAHQAAGEPDVPSGPPPFLPATPVADRADAASIADAVRAAVQRLPDLEPDAPVAREPVAPRPYLDYAPSRPEPSAEAPSAPPTRFEPPPQQEAPIAPARATIAPAAAVTTDTVSTNAGPPNAGPTAPGPTATATTSMPAPSPAMETSSFGGGGRGASTATVAPPSPSPEPKPAESRSKMRSTIEWIVVGGTALILALIIRAFLFQTFFIPSPSMTPTLKVHDRILVNKLAYDVHGVHRGDIVVFRRDGLRGIPNDEIKNLVKRVVGLPGDTIETTPDGQVMINGTVLKESYLPKGTVTIPSIQRMTIPAHHYFVMGDNRTNSSDSRVFGPIDKSLIVGRAFVLIWPLNDVGLL